MQPRVIFDQIPQGPLKTGAVGAPRVRSAGDLIEPQGETNPAYRPLVVPAASSRIPFRPTTAAKRIAAPNTCLS